MSVKQKIKIDYVEDFLLTLPTRIYNIIRNYCIENNVYPFELTKEKLLFCDTRIKKLDKISCAKIQEHYAVRKIEL